MSLTTTMCPSTGVMSLGLIRNMLIEARKKPTSRVERELAMCDGCTGECRKEANRYMRPKVQSDGTITLAACEHGGQRRIPYAGKTFGDYEETGDNATARKIAKWFTAEDTTKSLYLFGETGTGKTFLASLIARNFDDVIFGDIPSLLDEIKQTFNGKGSSTEVVGRYSRCEMLVLDDLGAGQVTDWSVSILYQIINNRYVENRRMIVTSNFDLEGLRDRLSVKDKAGKIVDSFTAKRITSRLNGMCVKAFLGMRDRRNRKSVTPRLKAGACLKIEQALAD